MIPSYSLNLLLAGLSLCLQASVAAGKGVWFSSFTSCEDNEVGCSFTGDNSWKEFDHDETGEVRLVNVNQKFSVAWHEHDESKPVRLGLHFLKQGYNPMEREHMRWDKSKPTSQLLWSPPTASQAED